MSAIYTELREAEKECRLSTNKFIPSHVIQQSITISSVRQFLPQEVFQQNAQLTDIDMDRKILSAKKVIAVLVRIGQSSEVARLLVEGLEDKHLPLRMGNVGLMSCCGNKTFSSFNRWDLGQTETFLEKQWLVLEPELNFNTFEPSSILIDRKCALELAFSSCGEVTDPLASRVHVYKSAPKLIGHSEKLGNGNDIRPAFVAIKIFEKSTMRAFKDEKDILETIVTRGIKHDHLVRHLAICDEIPCILFPWAEGGDLSQVWHAEGSKEPEDVMWALEQITGLASALASLHRENIRHGDLKPANILSFGKEARGTLKIADLGVGRAHRVATDLREGITTTKASTRVYEGPEAYGNNNKRPRVYDCWSMGCILLEFVIWLLYDSQAIQSFKYARDPDDYSYYSCYRLRPSPQNKRPLMNTEIHQIVDEAICCLREDPRCSGTALEDVVNVVHKDLLRINPNDRLLASDLHRKLQAITQHATQNRPYLVNRVDNLPTIDPIFSEPPDDAAWDATIQYTSQP